MSAQGAATGVAAGSAFGPEGAAIGGALGALGLFDSDAKDPMAEAYAQARRDMQAIGLPPDLSHEIVLQQFREAGQLTPELEQQLNMNYSQEANMQEDLTGRNAQLEALNLMKQRGHGLGAEERAAFNEMRDQSQRDAEAKRQQIMQSMAARGQGGSGAELMAALQGAQASNTELSKQGDRMASTAAQNALQAISQQGQIGAGLRQQDYNAAMAKAKAQDALTQFNLRNQMGMQQRNIAAMNQAQAANLQNKQNIANSNTQMANSEKYRQENAKRNYWHDRLEQASGQASAGSSYANAMGGVYAKQGMPQSDMQQMGQALINYNQGYKKEHGGKNLGDAVASWWKGLGSSDNDMGNFPGEG